MNNIDESPIGDLFPVIGIMAEDRAGKDTMADMLVERGWHRIAFADRLKEAVEVINPRIKIPYRGSMRLNEAIETYGEDWVKSTCPEYREFLISFGTNALRWSLGMNTIWVDYVVNSVEAIANWEIPPVGVVITDVRDLLEAVTVVDQLGGYLIELRSSRGKGHYAPDEQVHQMRKMVSHTVTNNGTLKDLELQVLRMEELILADYTEEGVNDCAS